MIAKPSPRTALNDDVPDYHCDGEDFGYVPPTGSCYEALEIMPMSTEMHTFGHGPELHIVELPWRISSRKYFSVYSCSIVHVSDRVAGMVSGFR